MATKLLQNLADDNPDLQKQIGCMTGIFQLFDRQQMVSGGHRYGQRRLLPANPGFCDGGIDREYIGAYLRQPTEELVYRFNPSERLRFSTESSRASISSSCSSSLSSLECSRSAKPISSPFDRSVFSEARSIDPIPRQLGSSSPNLGRKSIDLRNAVKDSMYCEAGRVGLQVKHKNDGISCRDGLTDINKVPTDIKESLKVLANLRESPWYYNDVGQLLRSSSARDQSSQSLARDAPRFSCDGRDQIQNQTLFESRETLKSTMKLKDLPRRSLDGREGSVNPSHSALNSNLVQKSSEKIGEKRPPSIVAKLMGLEPLSEPSYANESAPVALKITELTEMPKGYELNSRTRGFESLGGSMKEPESPQRRNPDGTIRPVPRIPNEPAPWRQSDGNRVLLKTGQKPVKVSAKTRDSVPSVYGEIEKRLKDLEFKQSGKDLRALKQILEAIQVKGLLESRKDDRGTNNGGNRNSLRPIPGTEKQQLEQGNHLIDSGSRGRDDMTVFESPIVIMKPAKFVEQDGFVDSSSIIPIEDLSNLPGFQGGITANTRKGVVADRRMPRDQSPKPSQKNSASSKNVKSNQIPSRPRPIPKENSTRSMPKNSSLASPRMPQKKLETERRAHLPTPPCDANKSKRISHRKMSEAASPGGRHRIKYSNSNPSQDQMSEVSIGSRTQSYQGDEASVHSDGSNFLSSKFDIDVSSRSPSTQSIQFSESMSMSMDVRDPLVDEDEVFSELLTVATEHHSPVSVLDPSAHIDDDLTPVKITQNSLRESSALVLSRDYGEYTLDAKLNTTSTSSVPEIDRKKLQNIEKLVQKLRRVNSTHDEESTDYIASLCENSNPDHRYISEILLASGLLLRDLGSSPATFQFHSSSQPINPELFFVLEQTKSSGTMKNVLTKPHRKLIFDSVNEFLTQKISDLGVLDEPWLMSAGNLASKMPTAQKLLKQLCTEIDLLNAKKTPAYSSSLDLPNKDNHDLKGILWEDDVRLSGSWTEWREETSSLVLGIERLIFKDLVNEILVECGTGSRTKRASRRRGLFSS